MRVLRNIEAWSGCDVAHMEVGSKWAMMEFVLLGAYVLSDLLSDPEAWDVGRWASIKAARPWFRPPSLGFWLLSPNLGRQACR